MDVWHISSIPEHENVFTPEPPPPLVDSSSPGDTSHHATDIAGSSSDGTLSNESESSVRSDPSFCERVIGNTWSGSPAIILRSLRVPGRDEAACAARWLRGDSGNCVFEDGWTDVRLRLLADEWAACTGGPGGLPSTAEAALQSEEGLVDDGAVTYAEAAPQAVAKPFMVHTGHLVVPFMNGRVTKKGGDVVGHGLVLAVDSGVDWRKWESHLLDVAEAATRWLQRLEREGAELEKGRVETWAKKLLHGGGVR